MNKSIRLMVMISLFLGLVLVAQNQVAWANQSSDPSGSVREAEGQSVAAGSKDDCKDKNKNKDKCNGTVKPPPKELYIPVTGDYSIGGFCTLSVVFHDPAVTMDASLKAPLPRELPDKVHKVKQGCLLTYYNSNQRIPELSSHSGSATICFAATPKKQMVVYFYDIYSFTPTWSPLETTAQNGIACASAPKSGVYVATFLNP